MLRAYKGYFEQGRFVSNEAAVIPDRAEVYVTVTGNMSEPVKTLAQLQNEALREFSRAMKDITDEPLDEEFDAAVSERGDVAERTNMTIEERVEWWESFFASLDGEGAEEITEKDMDWLRSNRVSFRKEIDL